VKSLSAPARQAKLKPQAEPSVDAAEKQLLLLFFALTLILRDTILPQAEWYHLPYFSVPPIGGRKVAEIKI
jgi:hypothetical protein